MKGERKIRMLDHILVVLFAGAALCAFAPFGPAIATGFFACLGGVTVAAMGANVGEHFASKGDPKP